MTIDPKNPPDQVQKGFPSSQRKTSPSVMDPGLQEPGMGHIWYYIQLCTFFPQQSNDDTFNTQLCHFKSFHQPISPFQREDLSRSSWQFMVECTRPFKDTNRLTPQVLAFHLKGILPRE
ncbi:hypothetical protein O181_071319 [Austropuccinia psidii MF-1]|uniref:Uncharacterized protein n=1 Tax=Austropuccinia psidii MF-1 TaxID=1389203 RepID=A0A9Q3F2Z4_9BASI|nr:hypothetical protein [Austropuccinia psidii MF-1]